jgi:hypothetical protein
MADYRSTLDRLFAASRLDRRAYLALPEEARPVVQPASPFANSDHECAEQVITKLVRETEHELLILTGKLSSTAHSALRMRSHLLRHADAHIRILIEASEKGPVFEDGQVDWSKLHDSALPGLAFEEKAEEGLISRDGGSDGRRIAIRILPVRSPVHFVVSDGYAYRVEDDDELGAAVGNQQDPRTGLSLVSKFNQLWELSVPIVLPVAQRAPAHAA